MEHVAGVEKMLEGLYDAMRRADGPAVVEHISTDCSLMVGTDGREWWTGYDEIVAAVHAQFEGGKGLQITAGAPRAFGGGMLSWFDDQPVLHAPDSRELPARLTGVARLEGDTWRLLQAHFSFGVPNEVIVDLEPPE